MINLNDNEIEKIYGISEAMKDIEEMLKQKDKGNIVNPIRTVIERPEKDASILYMPCLDLSENIAAMKSVTIFPHNPSKGKPTTQAVVLLSKASDGEHVALLAASYLTRLRTGAMSGLATDRLAHTDAKTIAIVGTGAMAFEQALGVLAVREIEQIILFNPTKDKAIKFRERLIKSGVNTNKTEIAIVDNVKDAVVEADVICCSTRSKTPVFNGKDIKPGTHVNGVGSYLPEMREVDYHFIKRANKIVVDDFEGAKEEAGELIHASKQEDWSFDRIDGELMDLITGKIKPRKNDSEITFFKSVGAAYFDLAVANGVYKKVKNTENHNFVENTLA